MTLSYRALQYLSVIGVAPRWIDLLLLILTGACLFVGGMGCVIGVMFATWQPFAVSVVAFVITGLIFWWSNNFRHRKEMSGSDSIPGEVQLLEHLSEPSRPLLVIPIDTPKRVIPIDPPICATADPKRTSDASGL